MKIHFDNNVSFTNLYVARDLTRSQRTVAEYISQRLLNSSTSGKSYINKIKDIGYDVLITPSELYNPDAVRLCIIKDMNSQRLSDGSYDYLDAKIIKEEAYKSFSPQEFYSLVVEKTTKSAFSFKKLFEFFSGLFK